MAININSNNTFKNELNNNDNTKISNYNEINIINNNISNRKLNIFENKDNNKIKDKNISQNISNKIILIDKKSKVIEQEIKPKYNNQFKHNNNRNINIDLSKDDSNRPMINLSNKLNRNSKIKEININNSINADFLNNKNKSLLVNELNNGNESVILKFLNFFFEYYKEKKICLLDITYQKGNMSNIIIRASLFLLTISFIFAINCFFFNESKVHNRYINALNGGYNNISYFFKEEFTISIYSALIGDIFKFILIQIVINYIFRITDEDKTIMNNSFIKKLNKAEFEQLKNKRENYLNKHFLNYTIYFAIIFIINLILGYICSCYGGVFPNSYSFFIYSFIFSFIMSLIFSFIFFLIIFGFYKLLK